jgi:hypothetical protein
LALPVLIVVGYSVWSLVIQKQIALGKKARVVNSRAPELTQPFVCDLNSAPHTGNVQTYVKSVERGVPANVFQTFMLYLGPERKLNISEFDEIPNGDCRTRPGVHTATNLAAGGRDTMTMLPPPRLARPLAFSGEPTGLYGVSCIYYSDGAGSSHATCDTYRFRPADGNALFLCDAEPKTGKFDEKPVGGCSN